jgi:hypothetical protein
VKKIFIIIPLVILLIGLIVIEFLYVGNQEPEASKELSPVVSFGNQRQETEYFNSSLQEGWIYSWEAEKIPSQLVKFQPEKPEEKKVIYTKTGDVGANYFTALNGRIYFVDMPEEGGDYEFYRTKEGGNWASSLGKVDHYAGLPWVLTEDGIVYQDNKSIYIMDLDGRNKERIDLDKNNSKCQYNLAGLDGGYIYYTKDTTFAENGDEYEEDDDTILYRIKPDEMKEETLLDLTDVTEYVVDQNQIYFYRPDNPHDAESKGDLIQKSINGEEKVLVHSIRCRCLNKEGDWLYFSDNDKVYKLNVAKEGKKQLVYDLKDEENTVVDIYLDGGGILFEAQTKKIYIKKDGTVIDLTEFIED